MSTRLSRPSSATSHSSRISQVSHTSHSSRTSHSSEQRLECKAAYLTVLDDLHDDLTTKQDFILALQQAGRNPTQKMIRKYWDDDRESMSFDEFVDVCRKEPPTSEDDLMKAFRKIDLNGDGYISLDELYKIMTTRGEKMSRSEVKMMIDEVDENKDGRLDYREFCKMFVSTAEECKKMSLKVMERKERRKRKEDGPTAAPRKDKEEGSVSGSQLSIRSAASDKNNAASRKDMGSKASLRSQQSRNEYSLRSEGKGKEKEGESAADTAENAEGETAKESAPSRASSRVSLQSQHSRRKYSLRSEGKGGEEKEGEGVADTAEKAEGEEAETPKENVPSRASSRVSLQSQRSRRKSSVKSEAPEEVIEEKPVEAVDEPEQENKEEEKVSEEKPKEETPSRSGSQVSLRSQRSQRSERKLSQASLRSAGRSGSRQSLLSIDDLPKPSPRGNKRAPVIGRLPVPSKLQFWYHTKSKGCFFVDEKAGFVSHQYQLTLTEDTCVWFTIQPLKIGDSTDRRGVVDTALYILRDDEADDDALVTFTEQRDSRGCHGVKCDLSAGEYCLLPFTTGCRLKPRKSEPPREAKLVTKDSEDKVVLTKGFKKALEEIFEIADLDGNGLLSRNEFNWFNIRTSDDEVADDEWQVVEENVELENGEITKRGFISLNEMEAEDNSGDTEDLWITLNNMGFNKALEMDEACPFLVDVYAEDGEAILKVTKLDNPGKLLENAVCSSAIAKGEASKVKAVKDLTMYTYVGDARATIVVENKSRTKVSMELDCSKSKNCVSNHEDLIVTASLPPHSKKVGVHLLPEDERAEWSVRCTETILK